MFFVAYTLNHGNNDLQDCWSVVDTAKDAQNQMALIQTWANLHCAAWGQIAGATEPHWLDA